MDQEIIDRAAKAVAEVTDDINGYDNESVAMAVIKAIQEPTEKMCIEGAMTLPDYDPSADDARDCWKNMIDAILGT